MGRSISSGSQYPGGGQVIQVKSGGAAIAPNDLVALGGNMVGLIPIKRSDYAKVSAAGDTVVALTTYSTEGSDAGSTGILSNFTCVDPATGDLFIADSHVAGKSGCKVWRFARGGALLSSAVLDSTVANITRCQLAVLSNGNIVVMWSQNSSPYKIFFQILNKQLATVVGKTEIASVNTNPNPHLLALAGGGFAVAYCNAGDGSYFTIRNNTGGIVKAPALIAGLWPPDSGNVHGPRFRLAQLSNGNIVVAIHDLNASLAEHLQYLIYDTAGNVVVGRTVPGTGTGGSTTMREGYPEVAVIPGYFCFGVSGNAAYVVSNDGVLQGGKISLSGYTTNGQSTLLSDGTYFWWGLTTSSALLALLRITSFGQVKTAVSSVTGWLKDWFFIKPGLAIMCDGNSANVCVVDISSSSLACVSAAPFLMSRCIIGLDDFCAVGFQAGKFNVVKYLSASILGVAKTAAAEGNVGTQVDVDVGPGACIINEIAGTAGIGIDHSGGAPAGNKGVLYNNSVVLKGI